MAGKNKFTNNGSTTLSSDISAAVTSINVADGAVFPTLGAGEYFYATLIDASNNREIVKVTARVTTTLTVTRGQDGTTARAFTAASPTRVELRPVRAMLDNFGQIDSAQTWALDQTFSSAVIAAALRITGAAATNRLLDFETGGVDRWRLGANSTAEAGANAGSDFVLYSYSDAGALVATAMSVARSTGIMTVLDGFKIGNDYADHFATGTALLFRQTAVPDGWQKSTSYNNTAIRLTSGNPSQRITAASDFTTLFGSRTLTRANLPNVTLGVDGTALGAGAHSHAIAVRTSTVTGGSGGAIALVHPTDGFSNGSTSEATDNEANHVHTVTGTTDSINGGVTQTSLNFSVDYVDVYIATKDA